MDWNFKGLDCLSPGSTSITSSIAAVTKQTSAAVIASRFYESVREAAQDRGGLLRWTPVLCGFREGRYAFLIGALVSSTHQV